MLTSYSISLVQIPRKILWIILLLACISSGIGVIHAKRRLRRGRNNSLHMHAQRAIKQKEVAPLSKRGVSLESFVPASIVQRLVATAIDTIIVVVLSVFIFFLAMLCSNDTASRIVAFLLGQAICMFFYGILPHLLKKCGTPGELVMGLQRCNSEGKVIAWYKLALREVMGCYGLLTALGVVKIYYDTYNPPFNLWKSRGAPIYLVIAILSLINLSGIYFDPQKRIFSDKWLRVLLVQKNKESTPALPSQAKEVIQQ